MREMPVAFRVLIVLHLTQPTIACEPIGSELCQRATDFTKDRVAQGENRPGRGGMGEAFTEDREVEGGVATVELVAAFDETVFRGLRGKDNETTALVATNVS